MPATGDNNNIIKCKMNVTLTVFETSTNTYCLVATTYSEEGTITSTSRHDNFVVQFVTRHRQNLCSSETQAHRFTVM